MGDRRSVARLWLEAVAVFGRDHAAGTGAGEMGAEQQGIRRRRIRQESASSGACRIGIDISARSPFRMSALDRVVQDVTSYHAAVANPHTQMPWCMPRRSLESDVAGERRVGRHRVDKPGVDHGPNGIGECGRVQGIRRLRPVLDISSSEQIARTGEGRDPYSVDQTRVPTHVIDVQVSADDHVDRVRVEPGRSQVREERPVLVIEFRDQRAVFQVARACVNHDAKPVGLNNKAMKAHQVPTVGIDEVGHEPRLGGDVRGRRLGEEVERERHYVLDHSRDTHSVDVP